MGVGGSGGSGREWDCSATVLAGWLANAANIKYRYYLLLLFVVTVTTVVVVTPPPNLQLGRRRRLPVSASVTRWAIYAARRVSIYRFR